MSEKKKPEPKKPSADERIDKLIEQLGALLGVKIDA